MARSRSTRASKKATEPAKPAGSSKTTPSGSGRLRRSPGRSYGSHREWLLARHGPICAYCGTRMPVDAVTLDHVRPRKGQSAYDRPDNLVLACRACNAAKADTPFLAFLMAKRSRGVFLLHYGDHLSEPLKALARNASERPLLPPD